MITIFKLNKERHIIALLLSVTLLIIGFIFLIPTQPENNKNLRLPWLIEVNKQGDLTVFDITLQQTTLAQARFILQKEEELTLFKKNKTYSLEAYFGRINLNGLKGDFILTLAVSSEQFKLFYQNGARMSKMGSGEYKITLSSQDFPTINQLKIQYITYIPTKNLNHQMIIGRFGQPQTKIKESETSLVHWLYPKKGLDIAVSEKGKEVLQYFPPEQFKKVTNFNAY